MEQARSNEERNGARMFQELGFCFRNCVVLLDVALEIAGHNKTVLGNHVHNLPVVAI